MTTFTSTMLPQNTIIAIVGPTGVGKTKLSITLAHAVRGEIVSVDSIQAYRHAKIMSGQVLASEMQGIKHHMIDYLDAHEEPLDFVDKALAAIRSIQERDRMPVICGGSLSLTKPLLLHPAMKSAKLYVIVLNCHLSTVGHFTDLRIDRMLEEGLLVEVKQLRELEKAHSEQYCAGKGVWKSIGYPELRPCLENGEESKNNERLLAGIQLMKENTRIYATRQLEKLWSDLVPSLFERRQEIYIYNVTSPPLRFCDEVEIPAKVQLMKWLSSGDTAVPLEI